MTDFPPPPGAGFPPPPPPGPFLPPPPPTGYAAPPPGYGAPYGTPTPAAMEYAGVGARLGAAVLDALIVALMWVPGIVAIAAGPRRITTCSVDEDGNVTFGESINSLCEVPTNGTIAVAVLLGLLSLAATVLYFTLPVGRSGQTVGKRAAGVRVVDANNGLAIGPARALGRYLFSAFVSGNVCLLGYLWALWDDRKQTWHDKIVNSVVVKA